MMYRGPPMGRGGGGGGGGYAQPPGGNPGVNPYYNQQGGGQGQGHGGGGYMSQSDYEASPPIMRGVPPEHMGPQPGPRGGAMGRGYGGGGYAPQASPVQGRGLPQDFPRPGLDTDPGSASGGFESGSNSDAPHSSGGVRPPFANDCEIVVLSKSQQQYGEMVERELRKKGLQVDVMFPKGEVKIQEFLKPIAKLGTIFAVVIDVDSEQNRNLNFYQFRGHAKPQYHKNVPLTKAYDLIYDFYNKLKQKEIGIVPDNMKSILSKVLQEQTLKDNEYVMLVRFLQERRKRQSSFLNRTSNVIQETKTDIKSLVDTTEGKELQKRILSIMNE